MIEDVSPAGFVIADVADYCGMGLAVDFHTWFQDMIYIYDA